ncbi:MAG: hypothetical protein KDJ88_05375 [Bauldia sp.]|nr:hypothetical protein [Bauldia sp.]
MNTKGHWVAPERSWHNTNVSYCAVCGRLIPRRSWVFDGGAGPLSACSPDCETLYEEYLKPTYGEKKPEAKSTG